MISINIVMSLVKISTELAVEILKSWPIRATRCRSRREHAQKIGEAEASRARDDRGIVSARDSERVGRSLPLLRPTRMHPRARLRQEIGG